MSKLTKTTIKHTPIKLKGFSKKWQLLRYSKNKVIFFFLLGAKMRLIKFQDSLDLKDTTLSSKILLEISISISLLALSNPKHFFRSNFCRGCFIFFSLHFFTFMEDHDDLISQISSSIILLLQNSLIFIRPTSSSYYYPP